MTIFNTFKQLLLTDLLILRSMILDKVINLLIWVVSNCLIFGYLMPAFGLTSSYSGFILAGLSASAGMFEVFPGASAMINDFEGDQVYSYYLTLPMPSWLVWMRSIVYFSIGASFMAIFVLPIGKMVLWDKVDLSHFNVGKFIVIFFLANLFFGSFTLWITSRLKNILKMQNVWMRFVFPLWFLGCYQFSWFVLYNKWAWFAYLNLLNPITYIMEGMRGAILGQEQFLPWIYCCIALIGFIGLCSWHAIKSLKKRLDFV